MEYSGAATGLASRKCSGRRQAAERRKPMNPKRLLEGSLAIMVLAGSISATQAQAPATSVSPASYECAAGAHCNVSCTVDGDKAFQTGTPKTIALTLLAPNNYLVDLVEQSGETQHIYFSGSKVICSFEGVTRASK
jgi:hypothetical protein